MPKKNGPRIHSHTRGTAAEVAPPAGEEGKERQRYVPPCAGYTSLFYGDEIDLRDEIDRDTREQLATSMCLKECDARFSCLEFALTNTPGKIGVWGGMTQGERRTFKIYLRKQGYKQIPTGAELRLAVNIYEGNDGTKEASG